MPLVISPGVVLSVGAGAKVVPPGPSRFLLLGAGPAQQLENVSPDKDPSGRGITRVLLGTPSQEVGMERDGNGLIIHDTVDTNNRQSMNVFEWGAADGNFEIDFDWQWTGGPFSGSTWPVGQLKIGFRMDEAIDWESGVTTDQFYNDAFLEVRFGARSNGNEYWLIYEWLAGNATELYRQNISTGHQRFQIKLGLAGTSITISLASLDTGDFTHAGTEVTRSSNVNLTKKGGYLGGYIRNIDRTVTGFERLEEME